MGIISKISIELTGQTVVAPSCPSSCALSLGGPRGVVALTDNGLGLDATGLSAVSGLGNSGLGRDERPTKAPKAAVAAAKHGEYARVIGAGHWMKQEEQQIKQAWAAFMGATAIRMRAFRGPEPWRERT